MKTIAIDAAFQMGLILAAAALAWAASPPTSAGPAGAGGAGGDKEIQLLVREDDMGVAQAANEACIRCYRDGVARSVEVIVPGAWFLDAVRLLKENPGLDVGVHLTLTSEWDRLKWGPLTRGPSLVDENGYFFPATGQPKDATKVVSFLGAKPKLEEVERELRAQIELARKHIPQVSHLSSHMGTPTATPELRALAQRLAAEYKLPLEAEGVGYMRWPPADTTAGREETFIAALEKLQLGRWLTVEHPGLDTPEMRAMGHAGNYDVAAARAAVTATYTSPKVKQTIQRRGIKLISYADLSRSPKGAE